MLIKWKSLPEAVREAVALTTGEFTARDIEAMLDPKPERGAVYYLLRETFKGFVKRTDHGTYQKRGRPAGRPPKEKR